MGKVLVPKKMMERMKGQNHKKCFNLLSVFAVIVISTSAMSWIGFMNIKQNGGKLPWE